MIAAWIQANVERPLLVGPDSESEQWVQEVARDAAAPFTVLQKTRLGDRDVEVSLPDATKWLDHQPVLIDDVVSSARTMIEAVGSVRRVGLPAPSCIAVHAVFAPGAYEALLAAGPRTVVTCDTVPHLSNGISVVAPLAAAMKDLMEE